MILERWSYLVIIKKIYTVSLDTWVIAAVINVGVTEFALIPCITNTLVGPYLVLTDSMDTGFRVAVININLASISSKPCFADTDTGQIIPCTLATIETRRCQTMFWGSYAIQASFHYFSGFILSFVCTTVSSTGSNIFIFWTLSKRTQTYNLSILLEK